MKFQRQVENLLERKIKIIQCDGGGQLTNQNFLTHIDQCGIIKQISCPYTPKKNGVIERKYRHIIETTLTMMFHASIPLKLWVDAFFTTIYLINRMTLFTLNMMSPFEKLFKRKLYYIGLRIFGYHCFPYLRDYTKNKFQRKTYVISQEPREE